MRFPTMWYVRTAKPQISLCIRIVWSEPLLVAWIFCDCLAIDWTSFGVSKLKRGLYGLIWVYTCQNATLLENTCNGINTVSNSVYAISNKWTRILSMLVSVSSKINFWRCFRIKIQNWMVRKKQDFHHLCEDWLEQSVPRDHRLSSLGKPKGIPHKPQYNDFGQKKITFKCIPTTFISSSCMHIDSMF